LCHTFKNLPLKPLYDCWKSDNNALSATPLKDTQSWRPKCLASKKYQKISTGGKRPNCVQRMEKPRTNGQLFGCSWAEATLISVRSSFSKLNRGRRRRILLNTWHRSSKGDPQGPMTHRSKRVHLLYMGLT